MENVDVDIKKHYNEYIFEYIPKSNWIKRKNSDIYSENDIKLWCTVLNKTISEDRKEKIIKNFNKQQRYLSLGDYLYYVVEYNDVVRQQTEVYRKKLNKAVEAANIKYAVSTHSLRKSFGYWIHKTHPFDPDCLLSLQKLFNHTDLQITMNYIGLTEEKIDS